MLAKQVLFLISILNSIDVFTQTCVIGVKTQTEVVVGADSRTRRLIQNNGKIDTQYITSCKIQGSGKFNWVVIGDYAQVAYSTATAVAAKSNNFSELIKNFTEPFTKALAIAVPSSEYNKLINEPNIAQVVFFGFENEKPIIERLVFKAGKSSSGEAFFSWDIFDPDRFAAGHTKEIDSLVGDLSKWKPSIQESINYFVSIAAQYHPDTISMPADILLVDKNGREWLNKKASCSIIY